MTQNHDSSFNALKERRVGTDALSQKIDYESPTYLLAVRPWSSYLTVSELTSCAKWKKSTNSHDG